jgi:hypothetical protein
MQPTTLNKVVSLFLIGGICVIGIALIAWRHFGPLTPSKELEALLKLTGSNTLAVIGGLLVLSLAAVCGTVCESLTDVVIRPRVIRAAKSKKWCARLGQSGAFKYHRFWRTEFRRVVLADRTYRSFPYKRNIHGLAVGMLYSSKQGESIAWGESHYSTYVMSSNLALLSGMLFFYVLGLTVFGWCTLASGIIWIVASFALFCVLFALSLDRYLYSYQVAMRQSVVAFLQNRGAGNQASGAQAHNTGLNRTDTALSRSPAG